MNMKMKAAVVYEPGGRFVMDEVELAPPGNEEILVKVKSVGICHTDESARTQIIPVPLPIVLGHEGAGIVESVGSHVMEFAPGDPVVLSYGYCGKCKPCVMGKPYACESMGLINFAGRMADGTTRISKSGQPVNSFFAQSSFAEYCIVHKNSAVKVDKDFDLSLGGPLGCGIQTGAGIVLNCLKPPFGSVISVFGCGSVGLSVIMAARLLNLKTIIAVGGNEKSLELAGGLGATHTINRRNVKDIAAQIRKITGEGCDYAVDTSGVSPIIKTALASLNYTGKLVVAGPSEITIHTGAELGAKSIVGVTEGHSNPKVFIPEMIEYYRQGLFPFDRLISRYPFEEIETAFEASARGEVIKAVLVL